MGEMCTMNPDAAAEKHGQMQENVHDVMQLMNEYNDERSATSPMFRVFYQYVQLVMNIITFIKATHESYWDLHRASLQSLVKFFFFALDSLSHARMVHLYVAKMKDLEFTDPDVLERVSKRKLRGE